MKKKVIAVLLAVVLAAGSLGTVPAMAAETASEVAAEEEAVEEEALPEEAGSAATEEAGTAEAEEEAPAEEKVSAEEAAGEASADEEVSEEADAAETADTTDEEDNDPAAETADEAATEGEEETAAEGAEAAAETAAEAATADETASAASAEIIEPAPAAIEENQAMNATSGECGPNATWKLTGSGSDLTLTITGNGDLANYSGGKYPWESSKSKISKLIVGNGLTGIPWCAFQDCTNLKSVTLPATLTSLDYCSFMNCTALTSITIPSGVTEIPLRAFEGCTSLTNVSLPDGLKKIDNSAFRYCSSLTGIIIPAGVTEIVTSAFAGCTGLKTIDLPAGLTKIPNSVFHDCSSLTSITIPESVTEIGELAFYHCFSLKTVTLPAGVTSIGNNAFQGCSSLAKIDLPSKLTQIGRYTFYGCSSLTSVTVPIGVTEINDYTFGGCTSLKSLKISHKVAKIGEFAFVLCDALNEIVILDGTTDLHDHAFESNLKGVDVYTFKGCAADDYFGKRGGTMHYLLGTVSGERANILTLEEVNTIIGKTANLFCIVYPYVEGGTTGFTFRSADTKVATVSKKGVVTGKAAGRTYVTVAKGSLSATAYVNVKNPIVDLNSEQIQVGLDKTVFEYDGNPACPAVMVLDHGKVLTEGTDYNIQYSFNGEVGKATVTITGIGDYTGERRAYYTIRLGKTAKVNLTNVASGIKVDWKEVIGAKYYKVYRRNAADSDSSYEFVFTTSRLYGTDKSVKYTNGTKYTYKVVASESKTSSLADSPVFRTGTGYRLMPVGIKTLMNSAAGRMTVTYDKNEKSSGYVVRFGLKSDMSDAKVITVKGAGTTSRTFSGLTKGKTYYVQVRTYKLEDGVRYYSGYCTTKTVKIVK